MNASFRICKSFLVFPVILSIAGGCAGKSDLSPLDVQRQAFEDLRTEIREVIGNPQRSTEAIALVDDLEGELTALREKILARIIRAKQLNANYDTTRAEFDEFFERVNRDIRLNQQRVTKSHRAILAITTPDEWSQIAKVRTKMMSATIKANQAI